MYGRSLFGEKSLTGLSVPYNDPPITSSSGTTLNLVKIDKSFWQDVRQFQKRKILKSMDKIPLLCGTH